jgi:hypothetical protein
VGSCSTDSRNSRPVYAAGKEKNLEFPDTAGLPKIPASRVLREELLKDPKARSRYKRTAGALRHISDTPFKAKITFVQ